MWFIDTPVSTCWFAVIYYRFPNMKFIHIIARVLYTCGRKFHRPVAA